MTTFGMSSGLSPVGPAQGGTTDSTVGLRLGQGAARTGGATGSTGTVASTDRADFAVPGLPDATAHYGIAQTIHRADRAMEQITGMLTDLRDQLGFVKMYPPYPPDEPRRAALIRQLLDLEGSLEAVAGKLADQRAKFVAGTRAALGVDAGDGSGDDSIDPAAIGRELAASPSGLTRPGSSGLLHALG
jgi:hypothetical protein